MADHAQILVIGGGIAGLGAAYALANHHSKPMVTVLEAEPSLAYHTTGRSAAQLIENYGAMSVRSLTKASLAYLRNPPSDLADHPFLEVRGLLRVAPHDQLDRFDQLVAEGRESNTEQVELSVAQAVEKIPALRPDQFEAALFEPDSSSIDVAGLHQSFVRGARLGGAAINLDHRVTKVSPDGAGWRIETDSGEVRYADIVVNCAGAWGDVVAQMAGVEPIGLRPLRRTAFMVTSPYRDSAYWPLMSDAETNWYVKGDGPQLLCSPADETLSEPVDAKPEEIDIAIAIDRINTATTLGIRSIASSWAGLRTFGPDGSMIIGPDPDQPSFVWCVGQGGTGIQTSRGAGQLVADLVFDGEPGPLFDGSLQLDGLLPDRFS